jgi:antirestriction protein ArdC
MSEYQTTAQKPDVYQRVTDAIVNAIENGTGSYRMPWVVRQDKGFSQISGSTLKLHRGISTLLELELLSGQGTRFKPGLTDKTAYTDDEVAA